jgi:PST family polysaccharide transporter
MTELEPRRILETGEHERHLATSTLAQQAVQVVATLTMLGVITVLARRLSLQEFGTYGLLVSLTAYVLFIQGSIATAAVKAVAEASDQASRDRAFSTATVLYAAAGLGAGILLAAVGSALLRLFKIPAHLEHQAEISVFALAALTCVSWPLKVFQDVLRGRQQFVDSAAAEIAGYLVFATVLIGLVLHGAPLWLLVFAGASAQFIIGATSAVIVLLTRLPYRFTTAALSGESARRFLHMSTYLSIGGISGIVIYSLDRAILATFRSSTIVALYEGPVRAHNVIQQVNASLSIPVVPTSARYQTEGDAQRIHDLLLRGTRYSLAAVVPLVVTLMVLARPILEVWLGPKYAVAATAMTLLVSYWLINAGMTVAGGMLIAAGRARVLATYATGVAVLNLVLSLALTPSLGLNGVVLGTTISYLVAFPFFLAVTLSTFSVNLKEFAREAWVPAYLTGALVATLLLILRLSVELDSLARVAGAGLVAVVGYWAIYYVAWLRPSERLLVKNVAVALVRR